MYIPLSVYMYKCALLCMLQISLSPCTQWKTHKENKAIPFYMTLFVHLLHTFFYLTITPLFFLIYKQNY